MPIPYIPYDTNSTIAEMILRAGQQNAEATRQQWGTLANTVGALGQIPEQIAQRKQLEARTQLEQMHAENFRTEAAARQAALQKQQMEDARLSDYLGKAEQPDPKVLMSIVGPERAIKIADGLNSFQQMAQKQGEDALAHLPGLIHGMDALSPEMRAQFWPHAKQVVVKAGLADPAHVPDQYDPQAWPGYVAMADKLSPEKPLVLGEGQIAVSPTTGKTMASGAPKPVRLEHLETSAGIQTFDPTTGKVGGVIAQSKPAAGTAQAGGDMAENIANAIIAGEQPPDTKGLYRYGAAVKDALARKHYNLSSANVDWMATQKHIATLNGQQQTRLQQALNVIPPSLDIIDQLADEWNGSTTTILNKVSLMAAKQGALGQKAKAVANKLDAQISDVASELGNVYMGGNTPTDHSLAMAAKNLKADWDAKTLHDLTALARENVRIRQNSVMNSGVVGASANNPYAPPQPVAGGGPQAPAGASFPVTDPKGKVHQFSSQAEADAFKKLIGG